MRFFDLFCLAYPRLVALLVPELQGTTQEIARDKCRRAADIIQGPCITEDTALCFDALDGLPGPYIKDFHTRLGLEGMEFRTS